MVNQSDFVNNLKKRMYISFDNKFYLESIACSYAIIENRTKRICEHLGKSVSRDSLYQKTGYIYNSIKNKELENDTKKKKIIGFLKYRIDGTGLLDNNFTLEYDKFCESVDHTRLNNRLVTFRILRNEFTHKMYTYDSTNPKLINFEDYGELAEMGIYIANELCTISSAIKRKKNKLDQKNL